MSLRPITRQRGEVPDRNRQLRIEGGVLDRHGHLQPFIPYSASFKGPVSSLQRDTKRLRVRP